MPRDANQIVLDRLLVRAAIAGINISDVLNAKELKILTDYQAKLTEEHAEKNIKEIDEIIKKFREKVNTVDVAKKIKANFVKSGALAQEEALKLIYVQGPKLVLPVIVKIIDDLLKKVKERDPSSPAVVEFVEAAMSKVTEVDEKQNRNKARQVLLLDELSKAKIRSDMGKLIDLATKIDFHEDELSAWFEAILWIEGHFLREHNKALALGSKSKDAIQYGNGRLIFTADPEVVAPIDDEDKTICYGEKTLGIQVIDPRHITKHFINSHFHALAVLLESKVKSSMKLDFTIVDVFPTSLVKEYMPRFMAVKAGEKNEGLKSDSIKIAPVIALPSSSVIPYEKRLKKDGTFELKINLQADYPPEKIAEAMRFFTKALNGESIQTHHAHQRHGSLVVKLKSIQSEPTAELFSLMMNAFKHCELTGTEDIILHDYVTTMENYVTDNYLNAKTTGAGMLWRPTVPVKDRAHKSLVDKMWADIKEEDDVGKRKSVLEVIAIIQSAHKSSKALGSGTLYKVLENLMLELCKHYVKCLDEALDEKHTFHKAAGK